MTNIAVTCPQLVKRNSALLKQRTNAFGHVEPIYLLIAPFTLGDRHLLYKSGILFSESV